MGDPRRRLAPLTPPLLTRDVVKYVFVFANTQKLIFVFVFENFKSGIFVFVFEPCSCCICIKYSQIQYTDMTKVANSNSNTQN